MAAAAAVSECSISVTTEVTDYGAAELETSQEVKAINDDNAFKRRAESEADSSESVTKCVKPESTATTIPAAEKDSSCDDSYETDSSTSEDEEDDDDEDDEEDPLKREAELSADGRKLECRRTASDLLNDPYQGTPDEADLGVFNMSPPCPSLPLSTTPFLQLEYIEDLLWRAYTLHLRQVAVDDRVHADVIQALKNAGFRVYRTTYSAKNIRSEINVTFSEDFTAHDALNCHSAEWWRQCVEDWTIAYQVLTSDV